MPNVDRLMLKVAGEVALKSSRTRRRFLRVLMGNVRAVLDSAEVKADIEPRWSRLLVSGPEVVPVADDLARVFGLHSVSRVAEVPTAPLDQLVGEAADLFRREVTGRTFAVRVKKSGRHAFTSNDVAVALGDALRPASAGVDLEHPGVEVRVEIAERRAYLLLDRIPGPGGLPLGTGGRALALFSGGFDSPVAAWMTMRRGTETDLVVFDLDGCGGPEAALEVARGLVDGWAVGRTPRVHIVDLTAAVSALRARVEPRIRQVLLKRAMYRAATLVARQTAAEALVTGESLGQVSTQTLRNLAVAEQAAGLPVLRPLIGLDKQEIIARARAIGTHDASARVREVCAIADGARVETHARMGEVLTAEGQVDDAVIEAAVAARREVELATWSPSPRPSHVLDRVPPGAIVVDVREPEEGETVGTVRLPFSRSEEWATALEAGRTYLLVCTIGVRSQVLAGELRARGVDAYSLAGGVPALRGRAA